MDQVQVNGKTFEKYIGHATLISAIESVCRKLDADYSGNERPVVLLCTLHGALMFTSEVMQRIHFDVKLSCIKVSSYEGLQSTGGLSSVMGPTNELKGEKVILLEDVVDTGLTIVEMRKLLKERGVADVRVCTMLYKPESFRSHLQKAGLSPEGHEPEYFAIEIPDDFIVGFGLDFDECGRNYPDIYKLKQ